MEVKAKIALEKCFGKNTATAGNPYCRGRLSTVDLHIKIACFVN
jgi:hypothetical protein